MFMSVSDHSAMFTTLSQFGDIRNIFYFHYVLQTY